MSEPARVSVQDVRTQLQSGESTLLVCAYESDEKFQKMQLDGAISFSEFQSKIPALSKDQEIVFY